METSYWVGLIFTVRTKPCLIPMNKKLPDMCPVTTVLKIFTRYWTYSEMKSPCYLRYVEEYDIGSITTAVEPVGEGDEKSEDMFLISNLLRF